MKKTTIWLFWATLFFLIIGTGCEKDKIDYDPDSIIGKWEWLYSVGGDLTASYSYPLNGQVLTLEFKENGDLFFKENDKTYSETKFSITKDTLNYYENNEMERIYLFRISTDTLTLTNLFTLGNFSFYKRIK